MQKPAELSSIQPIARGKPSVFQIFFKKQTSQWLDQRKDKKANNIIKQLTNQPNNVI